MSKKHPAMIKAARILKSAGFSAIQTSALTFRIDAKEYNPRPLFVDVRPSAHSDNLARLEVCALYSEHTEYSRVAVLNMQEFAF